MYEYIHFIQNGSEIVFRATRIEKVLSAMADLNIRYTDSDQIDRLLDNDDVNIKELSDNIKIIYLYEGSLRLSYAKYDNHAEINRF